MKIGVSGASLARAPLQRTHPRQRIGLSNTFPQTICEPDTSGALRQSGWTLDARQPRLSVGVRRPWILMHQA